LAQSHQDSVNCPPLVSYPIGLQVTQKQLKNQIDMQEYFPAIGFPFGLAGQADVAKPCSDVGECRQQAVGGFGEIAVLAPA
jgi:hypothetical protein